MRPRIYLTEKEKRKAIARRRKRRFEEMDHSRLDYITDLVCEIFKVKKEGVIGRNNFREYNEARQTIMYLAIQEKFNLWYIGYYFDERDHSTVLHADKTVKGTLLNEVEYGRKFILVKDKLTENTKAIKEKIEMINDLNAFH